MCASWLFCLMIVVGALLTENISKQYGMLSVNPRRCTSISQVYPKNVFCRNFDFLQLTNVMFCKTNILHHHVILFYLLIISGVEQNPGPPPKRVRKTGMKYNQYLTSRTPLHLAPRSAQKDVSGNQVCEEQYNEQVIPQAFDITPLVAQTAETIHFNLQTDLSCNSVNNASENVDTSSENGASAATWMDTDVTLCSESEEMQLGNDSGDESDTPNTNGETSVPSLSVTEMDTPAPQNDYFSTDSDSDDNSFFSDNEFWDCANSSEDDHEAVGNFDSDIQKDDEHSMDHLYIYDGAQITISTSMLLTMTFALTHNITGEAFSNLIDLISIHCKLENLLPGTLYPFRKWFHNLKIPPVKHKYCSSCLLLLDDNLDLNECPNQECKQNLDSRNGVSFFVEVPIENQLKKLMFETESRKGLQHRLNRKKKSSKNIEDIYDGLLYKKLLSSTLSQNLTNLTLTWNTDGVPLFKSSKVSIWPLFFIINELPYHLRRMPENLILAGLWIGPKKPQMLTYLQPFVSSLEKLENGISIETDIGETILVKGFLIAGTSDLPAKCLVCNMTQYNGNYSCPSCEQPGKTAKSGKGSCHVFPFQSTGPSQPKRTHSQSIRNAETASRERERERIRV